MSSDYNTAGIIVDHQMYILREVVTDLSTAWLRDIHQHRCISAEKSALIEAFNKLGELVAAVTVADTSREIMQ